MKTLLWVLAKGNYEWKHKNINENLDYEFKPQKITCNENRKNINDNFVMKLWECARNRLNVLPRYKRVWVLIVWRRQDIIGVPFYLSCRALTHDRACDYHYCSTCSTHQQPPYAASTPLHRTIQYTHKLVHLQSVPLALCTSYCKNE